MFDMTSLNALVSPDVAPPSLVILTTVLALAFLALVFAPTGAQVLRYIEFTRHHDKFHHTAAHRFRARVVCFLSSPWGKKTFYLSDVESIKKMFASNTSLHAHALADMLHDMVWDVPRNPDMTAVDKMVHQAMAKGKLGKMVAAFECNVVQEMQRYTDLLGPQGKLMPVHHLGFRIIYNTTVPAVLGPKFPLDATRIPNQILADSMQGLNLAAMLPILPRRAWNLIIPGARRGIRARDAVKAEIARWEREGGVATASDVYQNISKALDETKATPDVRARWINMVQFGFSGNTGETLGWILCFLLQSPKLLEEVMNEVNGLPEGALAELPLRQLCPHMDSAIHETLRFVGSVFSGRLVLKPVKLPGIEGTFPKGSILRAMTRSATFDDSVWGEDAHFYRGNRFVGHEELLRHLQVFGGGVSACPGRHFATHELQIVTAHVLRSFSFGPFSFHEKNRPQDAVDLIRPVVPDGPSLTIIDNDGERLTVGYSGFDIDSGVEAISGLLVPKYEPVARVKPTTGF